jgi:hypothetical protein
MMRGVETATSKRLPNGSSFGWISPCASAQRPCATVIIRSTMKNIIILISGGGSNMAAIVETAQRDNWAGQYGARVAAVLSNKAEAKGLVFARSKGITTDVLDHNGFATREAFDEALATRIDGVAQPGEATWFWPGSCAF